MHMEGPPANLMFPMDRSLLHFPLLFNGVSASKAMMNIRCNRFQQLVMPMIHQWPRAAAKAAEGPPAQPEIDIRNWELRRDRVASSGAAIMKRIISGFEVDWASERVFAERQTDAELWISI
jgi:hypothetical protein